jgi:hypothetical protein
MRIKFSLLLVLLILCPAFAGQQSNDNMSDEQYEALLIKLLTPMQNGIEPEFADGTEVTWRSTQDGVTLKPDKANTLKTTSDETYKLNKSQLRPGVWYREPMSPGVVDTTSNPSEVTISDRKVKATRYERTSNITYWLTGPPFSYSETFVDIQYQLGTKNPIVLREERDTSGIHWWAVTGIVEKQIGDRKYLCAEIKEHMTFVGGDCLTTYYATPEIPGNIIEIINEYHNDNPKAHAGVKSFVTVRTIISIKPPIK